jgi:hypothetical protein
MGRVLRRLSRPLKIRGFLVGPSRCDAKVIFLSSIHIQTQELLAGFVRCHNLAFQINHGCLGTYFASTVFASGPVHQFGERQMPAMKT